jgi:hypothetical protein
MEANIASEASTHMTLYTASHKKDSQLCILTRLSYSLLPDATQIFSFATEGFKRHIIWGADSKVFMVFTVSRLILGQQPSKRGLMNFSTLAIGCVPAHTEV